MWEISRNKLKKHSVTRNSSDLSLFEKIVQVIFANSRPSASNFKSFSRSQEQFFLTVGQNNFGNKIPFISKTQLFSILVFLVSGASYKFSCETSFALVLFDSPYSESKVKQNWCKRSESHTKLHTRLHWLERLGLCEG